MINAYRWYQLALVAFFALFALLLMWNIVYYPSPRWPISLVLLLGVGPLLLPLRGFLHANSKSCAWVAYLSIAYLMHGAVEAYANPLERSLALLEVGLSALLFIGTTLFIRLRARI